MSERTVDTATRHAYLQAMGITTWQRREPWLGALSHTPHNETAEKEPASAAPEIATPCLDVAAEWERLRAEVTTCTRCELCKTRTQTVFGSGNPQADWLIVGEAPGQSEDEQGLPFVGKAGQLLTEMLRAVGLAREDVYIANILKCRPPNNRDPNPQEIQACHEYLQRQMTLLQPKVIFAIGRIAGQALLATTTPIGKLRQIVHDLNGIPLIVSYHPAYLLRSPLEKRKAWDDLRLALRVFRAQTSSM